MKRTLTLTVALLMLALTFTACTRDVDPPPSELPDTTPVPEEITETTELAPFPSPSEVYAQHTATNERVYAILSRELKQRGYDKTDARSVIKQAWGQAYHTHPWESDLKYDYYRISGEGLHSTCFRLSFRIDSSLDLSTSAQVISELQTCMSAGPKGLATLSESDRMDLIHRHAQQLGVTPFALHAQRETIWAFRYDSLLSNQHHHYYRIYSSEWAPPAPGEPEYLLLIFDSSRQLLSTAVLPATEHRATLPASPKEWLALDCDRSTYLAQALIHGTKSIQTPLTLREEWADYYLGHDNQYEYYLLDVDLSLNTPQNVTCVAVRNIDSSSYQYRITPAFTYTIGTLPPSFVVFPEDAAAWNEQERLANLQQLFPSRGALASAWQEYWIGAEADRDHYALRRTSLGTQIRNEEVDALTVIYDSDGKITDIRLGRRNSAVTSTLQTLVDVYEYSAQAIPGWIQAWATHCGYDNVRGPEDVMAALERYYLRSETDPLSLTQVYYFRLPAWAGSGEVPQEDQVWIEWYPLNSTYVISAGIGAYTPTHFTIIV